MAPEPILVTGAAGFVGRHVMERARERGLEVCASEGDLRDPASARRAVAEGECGAAIHLAAPSRRGGEPWALLADELRMAGNVVAAMSERKADAVVVIPGSAGQYGLAGPEPLVESDPTVPVSQYGAIKCALERACTLRPLRGRARIIWARSFNHVGPGQGNDAPVPAWAQQVAVAERSGSGILRTGNLDVVRDLLDVRDVADAYLDLAACGAEGVVNVGSGAGVTLREVVDLLLAASTARIKWERDPKLERSVDPPFVVADVSRLRALTGWQPRITLESSLRDVLAEWRGRVAEAGDR